jgi:hypothetical protein
MILRILFIFELNVSKIFPFTMAAEYSPCFIGELGVAFFGSQVDG